MWGDQILSNARGRVLMISVLMCSSSGFLLIGYDNGVMGGLVNNKPFLDTFSLDPTADSNTIGTIVAIYEIGCFIGSLASAFYAERLGRRYTIMFGSIWMIIGAVLQAASTTQAQIILGRVVSGIGLGQINSTVPILQAEMSPPSSRGRLACVQLTTLNFGIMLSYWVDYGFNKITPPVHWYWRIPIALQLIFIIILLFLAICIPESPRWLAFHGRHEEALDVIARLADKPIDDLTIQANYREILHAVEVEKTIGSGRWSDILKSDGIRSRRRFFIACGIQAAQQASGINALVYYSGTIFQQSLQLSNATSNLLSGILNTWFFAASFIPHLIIDRAGRRLLLLTTIAGMSACFAIEAGLIRNIESTDSPDRRVGIAAAAFIFIYEGLFTIGFQAVVWLIPSEVLPLRLRAKGSSVSTATNWIINYIVVQVTPHAIAHIGWRFYLIFCVFNAMFLIPIYLFLPETAGRSLESVDALFLRDEVVQISRSASPGTIEVQSNEDPKVIGGPSVQTHQTAHQEAG